MNSAGFESNGQGPKAAREGRVGDRMQVKNDGGDFQLEVLALSEMRGPAMSPIIPARVDPQQLREALPDDHLFSFLIHERDGIFSPELDKAVAAMGVRILRTLVPGQEAMRKAIIRRCRAGSVRS